jgi:hypothetical protein
MIHTVLIVGVQLHNESVVLALLVKNKGWDKVSEGHSLDVDFIWGGWLGWVVVRASAHHEPEVQDGTEGA